MRRPVTNHSCNTILLDGHPRTYPRLFGKKIAKLMPELASQGEGLPPVQALDQKVPAYQALASAAWEDWGEANLKDVVVYLRGNKSLDMPTFWKDAIPRAL